MTLSFPHVSGHRIRRWLPVAVVAVLAFPLAAVSTIFWRSATFHDFSEGKLEGVSLGQDGRLSLAPALQEVFHSDQALIWSVVADGDGDVYLATGHRGRVYRLTPTMLTAATPTPPAKALFFTAPESEIFALALGPDHALYVGSSPDGKVYRVTADGKSTVYFDPKTKYIWSLAFLDRTLYAGTGDQGKIYKVTAAGQGEQFFDTRQRQVMTLLPDGRGNLLAGAEPGGLIYRIAPQGKAFVIFNAPLQEIHRLAVGPDGAIYATAQGQPSNPFSLPGGLAPRVAALGAAGGQEITVRADAQQQDEPEEAQAGEEEAAEPATATLAGSVAPSFGISSPLIGFNGALKSAIYRIAPDNTVDTLWSSRTEDANDILPSGADLLLSTDTKGRVYQLNPNSRATTLLVQTNQEETTRLLRVGDTILATTSNLGNLYRLGTQPGLKGTVRSAVKDTSGISRWGDLEWRASLPAGTRLEVRTRSGNSAHPDSTWSDWSPAHRESGRPIESPAARYVQWKATLFSHGDASPVLDEVVVPFLPTNQAPEIANVQVKTPGSQLEAAKPVNPGFAAGVVTFGSAARPNAQMRKGIQLSWHGSDPDGDPLHYSVYFRGEDQHDWKLLKKDLTQASLHVDSSQLPDGTYRFKVVASDEADNPPGMGKTAESISAPATLDTTPPTIHLDSTSATTAGSAVAHFTAQDAASVLVSAEYSVDAGPWRALYSDDGIIDARSETFTVRADHLAPGEHLLVLRVADASENASSAKAVVVTR